jgi:hypothetical protein
MGESVGIVTITLRLTTGCTYVYRLAIVTSTKLLRLLRVHLEEEISQKVGIGYPNSAL